MKIEHRSWYINDAETSYSKEHAFESRSDTALCGAKLPRGKRYAMWEGECCKRCEATLERRADER